MKLTFKLGMLFIFGYTTDANESGPLSGVYTAVETNDYLREIMAEGVTKRGQNKKNLVAYNKLNKLIRL